MKNVIIRIDNSKNFITVMRICEQVNIKWCNDKEPIDFYQNVSGFADKWALGHRKNGLFQ